MIKRLSHICLGTKQLEKLIEFYCAHINCRVVHEFCNDQGERYGAFLAVGNSRTFLEIFNHNAKTPLTTGGPLRHVCFEVDDIQDTAAKFTELGYAVTVKRGRTDLVLQFTIQDPDGNEIEFHQHDEACVLWPYLTDTSSSGGSHEQ